MQTAALRPHTVRIVRNADDKERCYYPPGPFIVHAASPRGAFRKARNDFGHFFTDHVSRESHPLECEGVVSDRTGKLLVARTGDLRQPYAGDWEA